MNFVCPNCKNTLKVMNDSCLNCEKHGKYHINNNIPIFFDTKSNDNSIYFQKHWEGSEKVNYPKSKVSVAESFLDTLKLDFNHKKVLDAGCGDGVHLYCLNKNYRNSSLYGIDISLSALHKAKSISNNISLSCSSIDNLPFKDNFFDIVFSYGVLAYTENPLKSFEELYRVTKKDGYIGIWIYPKPNFFNNLLLKITRWLTNCCNKKLSNIIANTIVPFLYILPVNSKINLSNASWNECKEVILVNISPNQLSFPTEQEIIELFNQYNVIIKYISKKNKILIWMQKY